MVFEGERRERRERETERRGGASPYAELVVIVLGTKGWCGNGPEAASGSVILTTVIFTTL